MKQILEGSRAVAETINNIKPGVVSAYPITPQTHIVEDLAKFKADGDADYEYVRTESEFAAISVLVGASAAGARTYTATSSQGLLLMTEVLYNIAGMRLPVVMTDANRAISGPINIWHDQQDAVTMRDAGWLMLYGENNQEICDLHVLAYKVAEQLSLPVMVNMDGFVLTHTVEPVDVPEPAQIKKYLPDWKPQDILDVKKPLTLGSFATPAHYMEIRQELHEDIIKSQQVIAKEMIAFKKIFGRKLSLVEYYGDAKADTVIVAMGSVLGTIKEAVDELNQKNIKTLKQKNRVAVLKITSLRPWPIEEILRLIGKKKNIAVIDKSLSLGEEGVFAGELRRAFYGRSKAKITGFIMGLGGRDITKEMIKKAIDLSKKTKERCVFVGK